MITVTLTLKIHELQARKLCGPFNPAPDADHNLATAVAALARDTITRALKDRACAHTLHAIAQSETVHLLRELQVIDATLPTLDPESSDIPKLMDHADAITLKLTGSHDPDVHQKQLAELRADYADTLAEAQDAELHE